MTSMASPASDADVILHARGVTKTFGGLIAVREVDLEVPLGGITSLIGPNGAGKTTLFNVIAGILDPTGGQVEFQGTRMIARPIRTWLEPVIWVLPAIALALAAAVILAVTGSSVLTALTVLGALLLLIVMLLAAIMQPAWYARLLRRVGIFRRARPNNVVKAGIGRTFQNIRLFANMTALENVLVGMHTKLRSNMVDALFSTPQARNEERAAEVAALKLLELVGLKERRGELAKNLPYGDQRRLELARALGSEPSLLLLDEPTAGMNPRETADMMALIGKLRRELGLSILLIEHDMRVVMGISDRVTVLDHGELIAEGTPEEVRANPRVVEAYLGKPASMSTFAAGSESGEVLLRLAGVHTYYGHIHALQGISLDVRRGEIVALIGSNGAGKTTTLRTISGLMHAREGHVQFQGKDITKTAAHELVRAGVVHAPEGRSIFPRMDVLENLRIGAFTRPASDIQQDLEHVFGLFPKLKERVHQRAGSLSGGEQQMLAIGRALMARPRLLLLDEPSLGLSPILVRQIFEIILEINALGTSILLVEQNAMQALTIAHRGYVLQTGRVVLSGSSADLRDNPMVRRVYLGED